ncbi:four helix bundle protein [Candidatus Microgenomates bacterium]|nr:four helix bundle protein [Candidatus Microgenomates bacterium]
MITKSVEIYKLWHEFVPHFPKTSRYTLGSKIDASLIEIAESILIASQTKKELKLPHILHASTKLNLVKFFLQVTWEIKAIDGKKYIALSTKLDELGRMLGGWIKQTVN